MTSLPINIISRNRLGLRVLQASLSLVALSGIASTLLSLSTM
jgi:hypothetical protein